MRPEIQVAITVRREAGGRFVAAARGCDYYGDSLEEALGSAVADLHDSGAFAYPVYLLLTLPADE